MMTCRKVIFVRETISCDSHYQPCPHITRVAAMAVFRNPFAGRFVADLSPLFEIGGALGKDLAERLVDQLDRSPVSYGKAAIVGIDGDGEQGGAIIHPRLGAPMRGAVNGGRSVIPSNVKCGAMGTTIDMPLGHKDDPWSFDHFDTMVLGLPDAPRADEIVLCLGFADGGRPIPRCGQGPVQTAPEMHPTG